MSKPENPISYYVLVSCIGVLAAVLTSGFYLIYLKMWNVTFDITKTLGWYFFPFAFLALGGSYALVRFFAETKTGGSGTHIVLEKYHLSNGEISVRDTFVKTLASLFTLGFGGSAGPEGPSLLIGGGTASNICRRLKIRVSNIRRIFIAGAAAGLAAVFRTPLTGILFALEIPYKRDLDMETFVEASFASIPSYLISVVILGNERIFGQAGGGEVTLNEIGLSLLLGLICGLYAIFFTKIFSATDHFKITLRKRIGNAGLIVLGAALLGTMGYMSIYSIGVGFQFVNEIISGTSFTFAILLMIILLKTFATTITLNFGGSGGLFFPTIVIGAGIGYLFATLSGVSFKIIFVAVGMAALLSGTHKILLTPTAFVVETLGGVYAIPALLASGVSYLVSGGSSFYAIQPRNRLETEELALEKFFTKAKTLIPEKIEKAVTVEFMTIQPIAVRDGITIKDTLETFKKTRLRVLPVVDDNLKVIGAVTLEDLGNVAFRHAEKPLSEVMMHKPLTVKGQTSLKEVAEMMIERGEDHVFVVDKNERLIGVISGIDLVRKILDLSSI